MWSSGADMNQLCPLGGGLTSGYAASLSHFPILSEGVQLRAGTCCCEWCQHSCANHQQTTVAAYENPRDQSLHHCLKLLVKGR